MKFISRNDMMLCVMLCYVVLCRCRWDTYACTRIMQVRTCVCVCVSVCVSVCVCDCVCVCVCVVSIIHNYRGDKTYENTKYLKSVAMVTNFRLLTIYENHKNSFSLCVYFSIIDVSSYFRYGKNLIKSYVCGCVCERECVCACILFCFILSHFT